MTAVASVLACASHLATISSALSGYAGSCSVRYLARVQKEKRGGGANMSIIHEPPSPVRDWYMCKRNPNVHVNINFCRIERYVG